MSSKHNTHTILVCEGTGCLSGKSDKIISKLNEIIKDKSLQSEISVKITGCHGFCQQGPIVEIEPEGLLYCHVSTEDVPDIINSLSDKGKPVERLFYRDPITNIPVPKTRDIPFYNQQNRIVLQYCGRINPEDITEYIKVGGYEALKKVLTQMQPDQVIEEVRQSGLRGRGGAGFPTAQKWKFCRETQGQPKYVICNADEGDPGAFMDRSIMEAIPHAVIEGMIIGGYSIGANKGFIYIRAEYPLAVDRVKIALNQAHEMGFLGNNILNTGFDFDIEIMEGAGAFVCGEETALIASIEGNRGMPRPRPPFPAQSGLWRKPTNINNVKTWATIPQIIRNGAEWFGNIGTNDSKGTAIFALTGKVANSGLVEVPMGTSLDKIVFDIGGGIPGGKRLKAIQTGGPSGGCIPAHMLNLPVEYEALAKVGSIMGSGGMVVLDDDTCIVDLAKYFLTFTQTESCGKCPPCRVGTWQMLNILERITRGEGKLEDIDRLEQLGEVIKSASLCALGGTAPNPVLTTIRYFREEYEEHIKKHHCRAAVCAGLVDAPCSHTCPAGIDVPKYIRLTLAGNFTEALSVIREKVPFPATLGRVCFHPCESKCRRGKIDQAIGIKYLKRAAADYGKDSWKQRLKIKKPSGKRVAIVGSGPAGLTAAYYLKKQGHDITVYESAPEPGGMMRLGIPEFRLPREVLNKEIEEIKNLGIRILTNTRIDSLDQILSEGYNAVFVATGAHRGLKLGIQGENNPNVLDCVSFLRKVNLGDNVKLGNDVAVFGGGNAAFDAARVAKRLGANNVTIFYRRTKEEMPAGEDEIESAIHEGIKLQFLVNPVKINTNNKDLIVTLSRNKLGSVDKSGRRRAEYIPGSEFEIVCDTVIIAIGQEPDESAILGLPKNKNGTIIADPDTLAVNQSNIFAGGDVVTGPSSVIEAIAAGRQAAISIDKFLGGDGDISEKLAVEETLDFPPLEEGERLRPPLIKNITKDPRDFSEVELGYDMNSAIYESGRCLRCDLEEEK